MNTLLDDETYTIEARLEAAKILLEMKDKQIKQLEDMLAENRSTQAWIDQATYSTTSVL